MKQSGSDRTDRLLRLVFDRGAENASLALSKWLGRPMSLEVGSVERVEIEQAVESLGPGESLVAACAMQLHGRLGGHLILVFEDRAGLALVDLLLQQAVGTSTSWGDLEISAAKETANIVGCAYLNALASHLPGHGNSLIPGPPLFLHEFAASLVAFALVDQATRTDQVLMISTKFLADSGALDWSLLYVPSGDSIEVLATLFQD